MPPRGIRSAVHLIRDIDELFDRHFGAVGSGPAVWEPPIDLYLEEGRVCLMVELPGVKASDIHIRVGRRVVLVSGIRRGRARSPRFYESEIPYGRFERRVELPVSVNPASFSVGLGDGILTLDFEQAGDQVRVIRVE
jgi:HSP20 family protein